MTTSHEDILAQFRSECDHLRASIEAYQPGTCVAEVEQFVFHSVAKIGRKALALFFSKQAEALDGPSMTRHDGNVLAARDRRQGTYYSIFGEILFTRTYYHAPGGGAFAVDQAVNVPPTGASDFRRKMEQMLSMGLSFADVGQFMTCYFPVSASTRALQQSIQSDSADAEAFEQQQEPPTIEAQIIEAQILVVESDNKCVVVVPRQQGNAPQGNAPQGNAPQGNAPQGNAPQNTGADTDQTKSAEPGRIKSGRSREGKMKEATLATVSLHAPFIRTPEQVHASLFRKKCAQSDGDLPGAVDLQGAPALDLDAMVSARYTDSADTLLYKRVWASMEGKRPTLQKAAQWAAQMKTEATKHLVRLLDGQPALQKVNAEVLPDYTSVLDLLHALSKLWAAADIKYGRRRTENRGWLWVYQASLRLLRGESAQIVSELDTWLRIMPEGENKIALGNIANYLERNEEAMHYDQYLALGWPIASGIIEGACRHVVKDRIERSGMGWTIEGVCAFLQMRCLYINGDWDTYHTFRIARRAQAHQSHHQSHHETQQADDSNVHIYRVAAQYARAV